MSDGVLVPALPMLFMTANQLLKGEVVMFAVKSLEAPRTATVKVCAPP